MNRARRIHEFALQAQWLLNTNDGSVEPNELATAMVEEFDRKFGTKSVPSLTFFSAVLSGLAA